MEQSTETQLNAPTYHPIVFTTYKVIKKVVKYSIYFAVIYFAYKGFMAWD